MGRGMIPVPSVPIRIGFLLLVLVVIIHDLVVSVVILTALGIAALLSIVMLVQLKFLVPAAATLCFSFLTIRMDDTTVLDFIKYAVRYFISTQQYYEWR